MYDRDAEIDTRTADASRRKAWTAPSIEDADVCEATHKTSAITEDALNPTLKVGS